MVYETKLKFKSFEDIQKWVKTIEDLDVDINLSNGLTIVDGKSLLGIYSIDISDPCNVEVISVNDVKEEIDKIIKELGLDC